MNKISKIILMTLAISAVLIIGGCGNTSKPTAANDTIGGNGTNSNRQFAMQPEMILRRSLSNLSRIENSDNPLSKEQVDKLKPIVEEIKSKENIDADYANQKSEEINNILTDEQKNKFGNRQQWNEQKGQNFQQGRVQRTLSQTCDEVLKLFEEKTK